MKKYKEFVNEFLNPGTGSARMQKIVQGAKDANWQPIGHNQDQTTSFVKGGFGDNWWRSFTRGAIRDEPATGRSSALLE